MWDANNYLDFSGFILYEVVGNLWLLIIIALFLTVYWCLKNAVDFRVIMVLIAVCLLGIVAIYNVKIVLVFTLLAVGIITFMLLLKSFKRS